MRKSYTITTLLFVLFLVGIWFLQNASQKPLQTAAPTQTNVLGSTIRSTPTIMTQCHEQNGLPDPSCTPGSIDPAVTQQNMQSTICTDGYTKTVRPSVTYTQGLKKQQIIAYGYTDTNMKDYEEDHLISLELGGNPTDPRNLWPEPGASPNPKDSVENLCHQKVCDGEIALLVAQKEIATNWKTACQ